MNEEKDVRNSIKSATERGVRENFGGGALPLKHGIGHLIDRVCKATGARWTEEKKIIMIRKAG